MPHPVRTVAVFCGSRPGHDPIHAATARTLGTALAEAGFRLVYGGGGVGIMGEVAAAASAAGGHVYGVIPDFLMRAERPQPQIAELEVTTSMHARKTRMFELADAFISLSGGLGTLDETFEIITWRQLGLHRKPILLLDTRGWAASFTALVDTLIGEGFVGREARRWYAVVPDVPSAIAALSAAATEDVPAERL